MRRILSANLAAMSVLLTVTAHTNAQQQPRIGSDPPSFEVIDVTGQFGGKPISYRAFYGNRTTICIFARNANDQNVERLLQEVDRLVDRNAKMRWAAFFVRIGGDAGDLRRREDELRRLNERLRLRWIPLTLTREVPRGYTVGRAASVVMWERSRVQVNLAFDRTDNQTVGRVLAESKKLR